MNYTQQAPRRKNYTPLPNEVFSLGLSPGELAVYAYLLYCEDRRTYQSWPSYKTIGRAIHRSKGAVKRYVDGLVVKGLITAEPTYRLPSKPSAPVVAHPLEKRVVVHCAGGNG